MRSSGRGREPRLRRRPPPGTRTHRPPALPRTPGPGVPAPGRWYPNRPVPGPAHPHGLQHRHRRHRGRPGLHLPLGKQHWLAPLQQHHPNLTGHHAAAIVIGRRGLGLRARRRASGNLPAPEDAAAPQGLSQPRHAPGPTRRPGPKPGNPPPRRTHGSHQAPRPQGPDGPPQATRRPKTVRGRPPDRTRTCQATRNGDGVMVGCWSGWTRSAARIAGLPPAAQNPEPRREQLRVYNF
jgi:hypothetical protein